MYHQRETTLDVLDLLEDGVVLGDTHPQKLLATVVLVELASGVLPEFLHVRTDEHLAELDEIAVFLIVHLDHAPRVRATPDDSAVLGLDLGVGADDGEGDLGDDGLVFAEGLFIFVLVDGCLEDADVVVLNVGQYLTVGLEGYGEREVRDSPFA